jgi:hypothetical protein
MSAQPAPELQRLLALLADRAVEGLPPARGAELAGLADHFPGVDGDALDRTAARIDLALAPQAGRSLTPALRRAILADLDRQRGVEVPRRPKAESQRRDPAAPRHGSASPAPAFAAAASAPAEALAGDPFQGPRAEAEPERPHPSRSLRSPSRSDAVAMAGWILAGVLVALWLAARIAGVGDPDAAVERASDAMPMALVAGSGGDSASIAGRVVWSPSLQAGLLRVEGMAPNDAAESRYQAWLVDGSEKGRVVPAGLFDVSPEGGVTEARLRPALPVGEAARVVVTLEGARGAFAPTRGLRKPLAVAEPAPEPEPVPETE